MDLVADVLGLEVLVHVLRHQVAAVGGGVDQHVLGGGRDRAVEHHLERDVALLARLEATGRRRTAGSARRARRPGRRCPAGRRGRSSPLRSGAGPAVAYLLSSPLTIEDLPVPRAPVSSTLLAGLPSTNWRVFCSTAAICASMPLQVGELDAVHVAHRLQPAAALRRARRPAAPAEGDARRSSRSARRRPAAASWSSRCEDACSSVLRLISAVLGVDLHVVEATDRKSTPWPRPCRGSAPRAP